MEDQEKGLAGRKPFVPTDFHKAIVSAFCAYGISHEQICKKIINPQTNAPIDINTLKKHFQHELDTGLTDLIGKCGHRVAGLIDSDDDKIALDASKFVLITRGGWKVSKEESAGQPIININGMPVKTNNIDFQSESDGDDSNT